MERQPYFHPVNMKRHIISFFAFLLFASPLANAQSLKGGEYTVNGVFYRVHESIEYHILEFKEKTNPLSPAIKKPSMDCHHTMSNLYQPTRLFGISWCSAYWEVSV